VSGFATTRVIAATASVKIITHLFAKITEQKHHRRMANAIKSYIASHQPKFISASRKPARNTIAMRSTMKNAVILFFLLSCTALYIAVLIMVFTAPSCQPGATDDLHIDRIFTGCR
jgi:Flp pilus assembly protein TadB